MVSGNRIKVNKLCLTLAFSGKDPTAVNTNLWVVADFDTVTGLKLASEALGFLVIYLLWCMYEPMTYMIL